MKRYQLGIPTMYNGIRFRSRLEAKWAAFFDLAGWQWEYEPFDLEGYIPDFSLRTWSGHLLVEVKADVFDESVACEAVEKLARTSYEGEWILLGSTFIDSDCADAAQPGFLYEQRRNKFRFDEQASPFDGLEALIFGYRTPAARHLGLASATGLYSDRITLEADGGEQGGNPLQLFNVPHQADPRVLWRRAANITQWRGVRA